MRNTGTYGKGDKAKADRLFSLIVRSRGICARCGETDYTRFQCAHIIKRRYNATRCDERNAWCLCVRCHMRLEEHPDEHVAFTVATIGPDTFDELKQLALAGVKASRVFWAEEVERLTARCEEVGINPRGSLADFYGSAA